MSASVPAQGWYVEIDGPNGSVHRPDIREDVQLRPTINDLPKVDVPVRKSDKWFDSAFEDAPVRIWRDGERLPIEELDIVSEEPGTTELSCHGGVELLQDHVEEVDSREAHALAQDLINLTSYVADVVEPNTTVEDNVQLATADSTSELRNLLLEDVPTSAAYAIANGAAAPVQTCWTTEAENGSVSGGSLLAVSRFSGDGTNDGDGLAVEIQDAGDQIDISFDPEYDIPDGSFEIGVRFDTNGDANASPPTVEWRLDGTALGTYSPASTGAGWATGLIDGGNLSDPGAVSSGSHTLTLEAQDSGADSWEVDVVAPYDDRFSYTFDNSLTTGSDGGRYLDGPQLFPDSVDVVFGDEEPIRSPVGGRIEATIDDTSGPQALALSNDYGASYPVSGSNTDTVEGDFAEAGPALRVKATLGRYGTRDTATPRTGYQPQSIDSLTLKSDLSDIPVVANQRFEGSILQILQQVADQSDSVFEVRWDSSAGAIMVMWAQDGQLTSGASPEIVDYSSSRRAGSGHTYEQVTVIGASQRRGGEPFSANHGTFVALEETNLQIGQEAVVDPATNKQFERGRDYILDAVDGRIKTLASGQMTDGQEYQISYRYKAQATYTAPGTGSNPDSTRINLPDLRTDRACGQAALQLVADLKDPYYEVTATLPRQEIGFDLIEAISLPNIPTGASRVDIRGLEATPQQIRLRAGAGKTLDQAVDDVKDDIRATAEAT